MDTFLTGYNVSPATWFYLSFLLIIAVFFRFNRFWSIRNFDLALLLSASPGLLFLESGADEQMQTLGYTWLFGVSALILVRLLLDSVLTRRPQFAQNLNGAGLAFLCVSAFVFLTAQAMTKPNQHAANAEAASQVVSGTGEDTPVLIPQTDEAPGLAEKMMTAPVAAVVDQLAPHVVSPQALAVRILAVCAHLAVVLGLLIVGHRLFGDPSAGWAMATLYLLLPCTAYSVGEFSHVFPAALTVWAFVAYRKPLISGALLGVACGAMFFPIFLLPLWAAFYGRRGILRFGLALVAVMAATMFGTFGFTSPDISSFLQTAMGKLDLSQLGFRSVENVPLFWKDETFLSLYRIPIIVAYVALLVSLTVWPRLKTVEHLLAHSAAIVVGTQFWYTQQGGVYLLWYLPLFLMVVFRPRLTHLRPPMLEESAQSVATKPTGISNAGTRSGSAIERMHLYR